jgi:hypothetical protein
MAKKRRLVLDRQHLIEMLGDPGFFDRCPRFDWLRETALETKALYDKSVEKRCCGGDWEIMRPVVDALFKDFEEAKAEDPANLHPVKAYLESKKGMKYGVVVIYYRATKKQPHPLKLQF